MTTPAGTSQYLVAGPPAVLLGLLEVLPAVPGTTVVSVSRDGAGVVQRFVVRMDAVREQALASALAGVVDIEDDAAVQFFTP